jgi:hypothetical protein
MGEEKKGGRLDEPTPPCISEPHDHLSVEKNPMRKTEVRRKITRAEGKKDEKLMGIR